MHACTIRTSSCGKYKFCVSLQQLFLQILAFRSGGVKMGNFRHILTKYKLHSSSFVS